MFDAVYQDSNIPAETLVKDWTKWIYKTDTLDPYTFFRCTLTCGLDEKCDYIVTINSESCYYGSFLYSGNPISTNHVPTEVKVKFKKTSNDSDTSLIDNNFIQDQNKIGLDYLKKMIYATSFIDDGYESDCAKRCLVADKHICNFFILANNYCQLGRFNSKQELHAGQISDNKIFLRSSKISSKIHFR